MPGWRDSAACSAVVPALGTPAIRKSGSVMLPPAPGARRPDGSRPGEPGIDYISDDINRDLPATRPANRLSLRRNGRDGSARMAVMPARGSWRTDDLHHGEVPGQARGRRGVAKDRG